MTQNDILFLSSSCATLDRVQHISPAETAEPRDKATMPKALSLCREGDKIYIQRIGGAGAFKKRLHDLGFRRGKRISVVKYAPLKDPMEVEINGNHISLRVEEAERIEVDTERPDIT